MGSIDALDAIRIYVLVDSRTDISYYMISLVSDMSNADVRATEVRVRPVYERTNIG